jgi:hypothetical protein
VNEFARAQCEALFFIFFILTEAALKLVADSVVFYNQQLTQRAASIRTTPLVQGQSD